ncbi:MAG: N-acetylmuramoyl-L-alanine amidase [Desulfovibrio sp.]|nr:N-acetylmuramoyl-L-alanine amidase [Desulfovibrio sp.]
MKISHLSSETRSLLLRNILPPFCFLVAICLLVVTFQDLGHSALPPTPQRYSQAKTELLRLASDSKLAKYRSSWEALASKFLAIYNDDTSWPNRPAALFRSAEALEGLAKNSFSNADVKRATACYEKVASNHPASPLADDALYRAAKLHAAWLRDDTKALELLGRIRTQYPSGDMLTDAKALEKTLIAARNGKPTQAAQAVVRSENKPANEQDQRPANTNNRAKQHYAQALKRMHDLLADSNRSCWRQPWENLEADFLAIHRQSQDQALAAQALFSAAESRHNLAKCSHVNADFRGAQEIYQSLPQYFAASPLADDALLQAANILSGPLHDEREARRVLTDLLKRYPAADRAPQARKLLAQVTHDDGNDGPVLLETVTWTSPDKQHVRISLELTGATEFQAKLVPQGKGSAKRLFLTLGKTEVAQSITRGVKIQGSLLTAISVDKKTSQLRFDLRDAKRFDINRENGSHTLIILVDASQKAQPKSSQSGTNYAEKPAPPKPLKNQKVLDACGLARQLGLSVETVFIDAGHGGKDPGTYHNNIVEKLVVMDVAKTLGRLLERNGLRVIYSRTSDTFLSLSQRTALANAQGADLFISIHINACDSEQIQGLETYYLNLARTPEAARVAAFENVGSDRRLKDMQKVLTDIMLTAKVDESASLAQDIQRVTISRLKRNGLEVRNNGTKSAPFHVLIGARMPAVLVELGYCTNTQEAKRLASNRYRELLAQGLAEGILAYRTKLNEKHTVQNTLTPSANGAM